MTCEICDSQNLVPNGDFEQYNTCPLYLNQLYLTQFWDNPTSASPDFFNQCDTTQYVSVPNNFFGFQPAHSGGGYSGIYVRDLYNYREYIQVQLLSTLNPNSCYQFQMYVNVANVCSYTTDDIGVYFSDTAVFSNDFYVLSALTPQINNANGFLILDTLNWTPISGTYTAAGGENFLVIGNFKNDANTDTFTINSSGILDRAYFYIDDVSLSLCTGIGDQNVTDIKIHPNPFTEKLNCTIGNKANGEIILYDIASRKLLQQNFISSVSLNTEQLAKGIYLYEVRNKNEMIKKGKVVKD